MHGLCRLGSTSTPISTSGSMRGWVSRPANDLGHWNMTSFAHPEWMYGSVFLSMYDTYLAASASDMPLLAVAAAALTFAVRMRVSTPYRVVNR